VKARYYKLVVYANTLGSLTGSAEYVFIASCSPSAGTCFVTPTSGTFVRYTPVWDIRMDIPPGQNFPSEFPSRTIILPRLFPFPFPERNSTVGPTVQPFHVVGRSHWQTECSGKCRMPTAKGRGMSVGELLSGGMSGEYVQVNVCVTDAGYRNLLYRPRPNVYFYWASVAIFVSFVFLF